MESPGNTSQEQGGVAVARHGDGTVVIALSGSWRLHHQAPSARAVESELAGQPRLRRMVFDAGALTSWDSSLLNFVWRLVEYCTERGIQAETAGLPPGLQRLLRLAQAVPEKKDARSEVQPLPFLERVGTAMLSINRAADDFLTFVGEATLAFVNLARGRARLRASDLAETIQQCGANAVGIVTLISYLVGVILAFMGAVQLQQFGASIYVADLVGIAVVREMGAMMAAIIMAGRTGAAFAAQLGTMKVTQEIDALTTMGISPLEFLVVPRMIALVLMLPLLCLYADFVGIAGGASIGAGMLGISLNTYFHQTAHAVHLMDMAGGLFKSGVYGVLIALAGCYQGFACGNSASAVGDAATAAVVTGIVFIVVACGMFAVLFHILGI